MSLVKSTDSSLTSEATLNIGLAAPQIIVDEHLSAHRAVQNGHFLVSIFLKENLQPDQ